MKKSVINDIEILRAVAVLLVVMHHAYDSLFTWQTPLLQMTHNLLGGWYGVDLFFVISGYVIARDLIPRLKHADTTRTMWRITLGFWIRRAYRLLPSAWLWLLIILLLSLFFNTTNAFSTFEVNLEATLAGVLQFANVRFAQVFMREPYGTSFAYWSLSLEEQFYLALPLLFIIFRRRIVLAGICALLYQGLTERWLYGICFRSEGLILGVLLAMHETSKQRKEKEAFLFMLFRYAGPFLLLLLVAAMAAVDHIKFYFASQKYTVVALTSLALVWLASWNKNIFMPIPSINRALTWIGSRSYAIYLIHVPTFFATREIWFRISGTESFDTTYFWPFIVTATSLLLILAEMNHHYIEKPFRKIGSKKSERLMQKITTANREPQS